MIKPEFQRDCKIKVLANIINFSSGPIKKVPLNIVLL